MAETSEYLKSKAIWLNFPNWHKFNMEKAEHDMNTNQVIEMLLKEHLQKTISESKKTKKE